MKSSYIVTACVVVVIGLVITWIARNTYWEEATVPMPMKGEARTNAMYAAQRLAEALGTTAQSRRALGSLPDEDSIIYLSYWNWNLVPSRREQLERWVERGGRLVADRSLIGGEKELQRWAGITRSDLPLETQDAKIIGERDEECADLEIEASDVETDATRSIYNVCGIDHSSRLATSRRATWILSDERGMQAVRVEIGRGSVTLLNADPFRKRKLFDGDNALLLVAATKLDRGDNILFLSEESSASLLELMWLHGAPVVLLAIGAIVLALWRGSPRFGPPAAETDPARRSLAEQIIGTGRFVLRFGGGRALHAAAIRALHEAAQRHVSGYGQLQDEARVAALARSTGLDESTLAGAMNASAHSRSGELRKVVELLESARRKVS